MPAKLFVLFFMLLICALLANLYGHHGAFSVLWIVASAALIRGLP